MIHKRSTPLEWSVRIRGMILKFWSWRDIFVTSNATCMKIVPNNNIFSVYTPLWQVFMYLEGVSGHTPNALTYQADCAYKIPHNLDKSGLSNSFLWLFNVHPAVNIFCTYGEVSSWSPLLRPLNVWICNCQLKLDVLTNPYFRNSSCIKDKTDLRRS